MLGPLRSAKQPKGDEEHGDFWKGPRTVATVQSYSYYRDVRGERLTAHWLRKSADLPGHLSAFSSQLAHICLQL